MSIATGLSGSIVQAFSWMLIHSLWQGLLFSFLAGTILMFTRRAGAAIRYNLLLALFAGFMFTAAATFFMSGTMRVRESCTIN
jgi:bla regulator protein BlaR1